jgi:hypothetical protein
MNLDCLLLADDLIHWVFSNPVVGVAEIKEGAEVLALGVVGARRGSLEHQTLVDVRKRDRPERMGGADMDHEPPDFRKNAAQGPLPETLGILVQLERLEGLLQGLGGVCVLLAQVLRNDLLQSDAQLGEFGGLNVGGISSLPAV